LNGTITTQFSATDTDGGRQHSQFLLQPTGGAAFDTALGEAETPWQSGNPVSFT
jgi:hypothetical protein